MHIHVTACGTKDGSNIDYPRNIPEWNITGSIIKQKLNKQAKTTGPDLLVPAIVAMNIAIAVNNKARLIISKRATP